MNVLHIIPSYYPAFKYGGVVIAAYCMNKALAKKGIRIDVMTTNAGLENETNITLNKWIELEGIKVKYFPYYFYEHYTFSPELFLSLLQDIKKYDLIHITGVWNFPVIAGGLLSLIHKKPYIISPKGVLYKEAIELKSKKLKRFYFNLVAKHFINKANALHYTTQDEKDRVVDFVGLSNKSFIVPEGIDLEEFKSLPEKELFKKRYPILQDKKYILFLGRITQKKGLDILVEAFNKISKDYKDLFLVIAGPDEGGYRNKIKKELKNHHLLNKTLFTGMLEANNKISAYVDAELFVLPSYSENFGMTVIEAMACGVPVIVSNNVGICKELTENNAGEVVNLDSVSLYYGMKKFLDNPALSRTIATNGRRLVKEKYDIDLVADMMIATYKKVINL